MSYIQELVYTFTADGAIPAGVFVKLTGTENVALCTVAGEKAIGVSKGSTTAAGQLIEVTLSGGAKLKLAEAVTVMKFLGPTATGEGALSNAGEFSVAQAMSAGAVGDIIPVKVSPINIIANE